MARYEVLARSYINNRIVEPGTVIEFKGRPGSNLKLIETPAKDGEKKPAAPGAASGD